METVSETITLHRQTHSTPVVSDSSTKSMISNTDNRIAGIEQVDDSSSVFSFVIPGEKSSNEVPVASKHKLCFQSKEMAEFFRLAELYAKSSACVLITGESGTGKELFSRLIHDKSTRAHQPLVAVNCAAIPEQLVESELFGHEKGAFTGALNRRVGFFERASRGTLLLDEISEIPVEMQAKLLRVIEEQEVQPVGGDCPRPVDVRIIATANRDLTEEVSSGRFRHDLYHRLNVVELQIPPLRQRVADIPLLIMYFVNLYRSESPVGISKVSKQAIKLLCEYQWPGNVRELRNVVHRACILNADGEITVDSLPKKVVSPSESLDKCGVFEGMQLADVERQLIIACLRKYNGSKKLAAAELGVTARTLSNKMKLYDQSSEAT